MKQYFNNLNKMYSLVRITKYAVILSSILLILDAMDLPSKYLASYNSTVVWIISGSVILFIILTVLEFSLFDTFKIYSINLLDGIITVIFCSNIIYSSISYIINQLSVYKIIILVILFTLTIGVWLFRIYKFRKQVMESEQYAPNVIDLKDILYNNFSIKHDNSVLVNEKDVDYDLLSRENVIDQLYYTIQRCNPDGHFVISLEGKWGSGKTTIINNVKKRLIEFDSNILIIDEFDPWTYSDQESLFYNMFDSILKKSGFKYSDFTIKKMINNTVEAIFGKQKTGVAFKNFFYNMDEIKTMKDQINGYLKMCGKKVVFFIDNIDRADSNSIILLFKLVGNVLDFDRVTYVLSFDDNRVKKVFEKDLSIDYDFLKKVIQMQMRVPEFSEDIMINLIEKCVNNLLIYYGENEQNLKNYSSIIKFICKETADLRDFKRFINSVISVPFHKNNYLNKKDLFIIQYIRLYNLDLYNKIHRNRKFFISEDRSLNQESYFSTFNKKEFNVQAKSFFDNLFSDENNNEYIEILSEIFPYVNKYKNNQDLEYDGYYIKENEYINISKNIRICSAKYFDLYFTNTQNEYISMNNLVLGLLEKINQKETLYDRDSTFNNFLSSVKPLPQQNVFEVFQYYISDLRKDALFDMAMIFFDNINNVDDSIVFIQLNARKRVEIIISELLKGISEEEYDYFINELSHQYCKIEYISNILYWLKGNDEKNRFKNRVLKFEVLCKEMGNEIVKNSINLYDDKYYSHDNIWGLYHIYEDDKIKIKEYINKMINEKNIYRLIYDIIGVSYGSEYKYSILKKNLECLSSEEDIDKLLIGAHPNTEDEKFVLDVYNSYKTGVQDVFGKGGVISHTMKNLIL